MINEIEFEIGQERTPNGGSSAWIYLISKERTTREVFTTALKLSEVTAFSHMAEALKRDTL